MNDKGAFERATKLVVANMVQSFSKRLETIMLYGKRNIGVVSGVAGSVITVTAASWAPAVWAGGVGMELEAYDAAGTAIRGATRPATLLKVTAVDLVARQITVSAAAPTLAAIVATDQLKHAYSGELTQQGALEFHGLEAIMRNAGTLFNINAATYDLWKSTVFSAGSAALTQSKINKALALAVAKGLEEDVECHVNPVTWENLLQAQDALRMYDSSYKPDLAKSGAKAIEFYGQNGLIKVVPNPYVKESLAFIMPEDVLMRVGSSEVTFKRPGESEEFFRDLENNAGVELRAYADMALFCHAPARLVLIENIVNS
jgi:hypothetical protein